MSWATIEVGGKEILFCDACQKYIYNATGTVIKFHLYIDKDEGVDTVLCEKCWKTQEVQR